MDKYSLDDAIESLKDSNVKSSEKSYSLDDAINSLNKPSEVTNEQIPVVDIHGDSQKYIQRENPAIKQTIDKSSYNKVRDFLNTLPDDVDKQQKISQKDIESKSADQKISIPLTDTTLKRTEASKDAAKLIEDHRLADLKSQIESGQNILSQKPVLSELEKQSEDRKVLEAAQEEERLRKEQEDELNRNREKTESAQAYIRTYPKDILFADENDVQKEADDINRLYGVSKNEALSLIQDAKNKAMMRKADKTEYELNKDIEDQFKAKGLPYTEKDVYNKYNQDATLEAYSNMDENSKKAYPKSIELSELIKADNEKPSPSNKAKIVQLKNEIADLTNNKKMWFDPVSGQSIEQPTQEAFQYQQEVNDKAKKLQETSTKDKLEEIFHKTYAAYKYAEKLYSDGQKYLTLPLAGNIASAEDPRNIAVRQANTLKNNYIKAKKDFDAISQAYLLNRDPSGVERGALKQGLESFANELIPSSFFPEGMINNTNKQFLSSIKTLANDYKLKLTDAQKERFENRFIDNISEGVGGIVGMLPKMWLAGEVIGTGEAVAGLDKALYELSKGSRVERGISLLGKSLVEEAKMSPLGMPLGVGSGFVLAGGIKVPKLAGKYGAILQPFFNKIVQGSIGGTAGQETGEIIKSAVESLNSNSDFKEKIDELFPNVSDVTKRIAQELIVNGIIGIAHLKKTDFIASPDELLKAANELYSKGYIDEANEVKKKADQIRGYEVKSNAEIDRQIAKGGIVSTQQIKKTEVPIGTPIVSKENITQNQIDAIAEKISNKVELTPQESVIHSVVPNEVDAAVKKMGGEVPAEAAPIKAPKDVVQEEIETVAQKVNANEPLTERETQIKASLPDQVNAALTRMGAEPMKAEEAIPVAEAPVREENLTLYNGKNKVVTKATKTYERVKVFTGDILSAIKEDADKGIQAAKDIIESKAYDRFRRANEYIYNKFKGQYDAVKFENKGREGGEVPTEYMDLGEKRFYSVNERHARLYSLADRSGKYQIGEEAPAAEVKAEVKTEPSEGDVVELAPQIQGGLPRKMVFQDGEWKQKVGNEVSNVGNTIKKQAQAEWMKQNEAAKSAEAVVKPAEAKPEEAKPTEGEGAVKEEHKKKLAEILEGTPKEEIQASVDSVTRAWQASGINVQIADTDQEYNDAIQNRKGEGSQGVFLDTDGKIIINRAALEKGWGTTVVFHEGTHPAINIIRNTNPELYNAIIRGLKEAKDNGVEGLESVFNWAESNYEGEARLDDEKITETIARIAAGKISLPDLPKTLRQNLIDFINKVAKMLNIKGRVSDTNYVAFKKVAEQIATALREGRDIAEIVGKENVKRYEANLGPEVGGQESLSTKERVQEMAKDDVEKKVVPGKTVSTRLPNEKKYEPHSTNEFSVSLEEQRKNPANYLKNAIILSEYDIVGADRKDINALKKALQNTTSKGSEKIVASGLLKADEIYKKFVRRAADNLLALHDAFDSEVRSVAKRWYDGANVIAQKFAKQYGVTPEQSSAVIAVLSPKKDWYTNVDNAKRILSIFKNNMDFVITKEMLDQYVKTEGVVTKKTGETAEQLQAKINEAKEKQEKAEKLRASLVGKKLSESGSHMAQMIRAYDETYNDRSFDILSPNGKSLGFARNKPSAAELRKDPNAKGKATTTSWAGYKAINKAIKIIQDGSQENISNQLGNAHKVRSFYNNIIDPNSEIGHTTADTHAAAAALWKPFSAHDTEVEKHMFGGPSDIETGIIGTYPAVQEAYKLAAKERGLLPREMQSITWEAVRGLFTDSFKTGYTKDANLLQELGFSKTSIDSALKGKGVKNKAVINKIWENERKGKITLDEARKQIVDFAKGIDEPSWTKSHSESSLIEEAVPDAKEMLPEAKIKETAIIEEPAIQPSRGLRGEVPLTEKEKRLSVYVAPFFDTMVENAEQAKNLQKSPAYKKYIDTINNVAKDLGIEIESVHANIGKYKNRYGQEVSELSNTINLKNATLDQATDFAAMMGALTPEVQESTIAAQHIDKNSLGSDKHTATKHSLTFDQSKLDQVKKMADDVGLDATINLENNTIDFLEFTADWFDQVDFNDKLTKFVQKISEDGIKYKAEHFPIESRFIESQVSEYNEFGRKQILRDLRGRVELQQGRGVLRDAISEAEKRNEEFIRQEELRDERKEYGDLRQKQIDLQQKGESLSDDEVKKMTLLYDKLLPSTEETFTNAKADYEKAKAEIEKTAKEVSKGVGFVSTFGIKRPARAAVKTLRWYRGKAQWLGDGARTNIIVFDKSNIEPVLRKIQREYDGGIVRQELGDTELGYPKQLLEVRTSNGKIAEFQVMTPEGYLAKDGVKDFNPEKQDIAKEALNNVREKLGWNIPDGVGHYFYEINRDLNVPKELRDQAKEISLKYYDAFLNPDSKLTDAEFRNAIIDFKDKVDAADKSNWDKGNEGKSPKSLDEYLSGEKEAPKESDLLKEEDGTPITLYHGSDVAFDVKNIKPNEKGIIHLSTRSSFSKQYGKNIHAVNIVSKKPFSLITDRTALEDKLGRSLSKNDISSETNELSINASNNKDIVNALKDLGYDSAKYSQWDDARDKYVTNYVVFDSKNVIPEGSAQFSKGEREPVKALSSVEETAKALEGVYKEQNPHSGGGLSGNSKAFDELPNDAEVYVYTATTPQNAEAILLGKEIKPEMQGQGIKGESNKIYVASDPRVVSGLGKVIIGFKVKKSDLSLSPEAQKAKQTLGQSVITSGTGALLEGKPILSFIAETQNRINTSAKSGNEVLSEAYHKAKADGSNPELIKAVEDLVGSGEGLQLSKGANTDSKIIDWIKEARDSGATDENIATTLKEHNIEESRINNLIEQSKTKEHAVQEQPTEKMGAYPSGDEGVRGQEKGAGVGQREQGPEATRKGEEKQVLEPEEKGTKIIHAETDLLREELGLGKREIKESIPVEQTEAEAIARIKQGVDVNKIADDIINNNRAATTVEHIIISKRIAGLNDELTKLDPLSKEFDDKLNEIDRLATASESAGSIAGSQLGIRSRYETLPDESLASYFIKEKDLNNGADLTDNQKKQVQKEYDEISQAKKALEKKVDALMKENAKLKSKKALETAITNRRKGVPKEKLDQEFDDLSTKFAALLKREKETTKAQESRGQFSRDDINDASSLIKKMFDNRVDSGMTSLNEIIDSIHGKIGEFGISKEQINDAIGGKYNIRKETRSEAAKRRYDLIAEARLITKYEQLLKGVEPKSEKRKIERNQKLNEIRMKIKEHDLTKLAAYKKRVETEIAKLDIKLNSKDPYAFAKPSEKRPIELDEEAKKLRAEYLKKKNERDVRMLKFEYERRERWERWRDRSLEVANIPRTIMSSMDYSAPLRQGLWAGVAHPTYAGKAMVEMFKQSVSQKRFDQWFADVKDDPRYGISQESGLYIADPHDPRLSVKEEAFMNNLAEKIPIAGKFIKGSERAYVGYLNKLRWDLFMRLAEQYEKKGRTFENSPELYKELANYINNSTGRGKLGPLETAAPILNTVAFSPRLIASRVNLLTKWVDPRLYYKVPKEIRVEYFKDMAKFLGVGMTVLVLAKLNGASVEDDPRSTDFGKIVSGKTRYDIWGGFQPYVRLIAQIITGQKKTTTTNEIKELSGEGAFGDTRADVLGRFTRGKLAPIPSMIVDYLAGTTVNNEETTLSKEAESHLLPLIYSDVKEAYKDKGVSSLFTVGAPAAFGVGVQTYNEDENMGKAKGPKISNEPSRRREAARPTRVQTTRRSPSHQ